MGVLDEYLDTRHSRTRRLGGQCRVCTDRTLISAVMDGLCCSRLQAGGGGRPWLWLAVALWLAGGAGGAGGVRTNVVAEVPQLDLGE